MFENGLLKGDKRKGKNARDNYNGLIKPFSEKDAGYRFREIVDDDNEPAWAYDENLESGFIGRGEISDADEIKRKIDQEKEERAKKGF